MKQKCVMISAGEASGDLHGAKVVNAIKQKDSSIFFGGIGGNAMKEAGVKIIVHASSISVVGITEVLSKASTILDGLKRAKQFLKSKRPDLLILIDFPDFNMRLAKAAKKLNIKVLYYISPQIWAWRQGRVKKIKKLTDHVAVILPFEEDFYKQNNVKVTYVGHPLLDNSEICAINSPKDTDSHIIGLLPGSRDGEISKHLPIMAEAAQILKDRIKDVRFAIAAAPGLDHKNLKALAKNRPYIQIASLKEVLSQSTAVIAVSGTVTLETAISETPAVIIYKISPISYRIGKMLIKVENIGLVNLIAGRQIVPELIQDDASPKNIADTVYDIIKDNKKITKMKKDLAEARKLLGEPGASGKVADIALELLAHVT